MGIRLAGVEHVLQFTAVASKVLMRRSQLASEDLYKEACKQVANVHKKKKVKNISEDVFGTKHAKIHVDAQQIKTVQTRKFKGLKETKEERIFEAERKKEKAEAARQANIERIFADGEGG